MRRATLEIVLRHDCNEETLLMLSVSVNHTVHLKDFIMAAGTITAKDRVVLALLSWLTHVWSPLPLVLLLPGLLEVFQSWLPKSYLGIRRSM